MTHIDGQCKQNQYSTSRNSLAEIQVGGQWRYYLKKHRRALEFLLNLTMSLGSLENKINLIEHKGEISF